MNCKRGLEVDLRRNEMPYRTQHHPRTITVQEVAATEHVPGRMFARTVTTNGGEMCMMALPAPCHVNPQKTAGEDSGTVVLPGGASVPRIFTGVVLHENRRMLNLLRDLGLPERLRYEGGVEFVEIELQRSGAEEGS